jgi:hypothetical protein
MSRPRQKRYKSTELSYVLELYFSGEDDEVAVENLQQGLSVEQARALKAEWRRVLARRNAKECLRLVVYSAMRTLRDAEAAWAWLDARYRDLQPHFDLVEDEEETGTLRSLMRRAMATLMTTRLWRSRRTS